jgi:hypothetical protein
MRLPAGKMLEYLVARQFDALRRTGFAAGLGLIYQPAARLLCVSRHVDAVF